MKTYQISVDVNDVHGTQIWRLKANDPKDAIQRLKQGEGEIYAEEIEVVSTNIKNLTEDHVSEVSEDS